MQQLPQELITKALALTGKNERYVSDVSSYRGGVLEVFRIDKFLSYLLSLGFHYKFAKICKHEVTYVCVILTDAIHEHQKGNSQPLIDLLEKI